MKKNSPGNRGQELLEAYTPSYKKDVIRILTLQLVFLITICKSFSQDFDLIVKSNGDSIACHIDSVNLTHVYFEMMSNDHWIHTYIERTNIDEFEYDTIDAKQVVFKSGTSIIEEIRIPKKSMFDLQRNSICFEAKWFIYTLIYERMFPLSTHLSIILGGGYSIIFDILSGSGAFGSLTGETSLSLGGPKHSFEPGLIIYPGTMLVRIGYRFQAHKGLILRPAVTFFDTIPLPSFSIGYSF